MTDELREAVARAICAHGRCIMGEARSQPCIEASTGRNAPCAAPLAMLQMSREWAQADAVIPLIRAAVLEEAAVYCENDAEIWAEDSFGTVEDIAKHFRNLAVQARERSPRALTHLPAPGATPRAEPRGEGEDGR